MQDWKTVRGSQETQPSEFDTTSSSVWVYQRRNVHTVTETNEDGMTTTLWEYEERLLTREEYILVYNELYPMQQSIAALEDVLCELDPAE